jgi:hypothetical protein
MHTLTHSQVTLNVSGPGAAHLPLHGDTLDAALAHMSAWAAAEAAKAANAKARNDLEAYIIAMRERLDSHDGVAQVCSERASKEAGLEQQQPRLCHADAHTNTFPSLP